jgi:hypothetical protein
MQLDLLDPAVLFRLHREMAVNYLQGKKDHSENWNFKCDNLE